MNEFNVLPAVCLLFSFALCAWTNRSLQQIMRDHLGHPKAFMHLLRALPLLPLLGMCLTDIPLPVFYLVLYVASCAPLWVHKAKAHWEWLFLNVRFLVFAAMHLIALGLLALYVPVDLRGALADTNLRNISLTAVTLLATLTNPVLAACLRRAEVQLLFAKSEEMRLFDRFVRFCICSVFFDSVPCLFYMPTRFVPAFLIGSNVLLLMMALLFARHVYSIAQEAFRKDEYLRLQEETIAQRGRTAQLEREAYLDVLTGIYTRQYVLTNMRDMLENGEAFALAFLDLDGLKQVNDREGHFAGDKYLQRFATRMKAGLRANDIFARYGGDEFLILFPDSTTKDAEDYLAPLRQAAAAAQPDGWGTPFSYGLVQIQADAGLTAEGWISLADRTMYDDKKRRRSHGEEKPV